MSKTIEFSESDYAAIREAAQAAGVPVEEWVLANLPLNGNGGRGHADDVHPSPEKHMGKTMADLFRGRVGLIDSRGDGRLSENTGERFADLLVEQRRAGRL